MYKILVVDDDIETLRMVEQFLPLIEEVLAHMAVLDHHSTRDNPACEMPGQSTIPRLVKMWDLVSPN